MRRASFFCILLCLSALSAGSAAADEVAHATYVGGGARVVLPAGLALDGFAQFRPFGGATFDANGLEPVEVLVSDSSTLPVGVHVCQDANADLQCFPDEPNAEGCGGSIPLTGFRRDLDVIVLVGSDPSCGGVATAGGITLRTS